MGYKRFRMQCVTRVVLLGATVSLFVCLLSQTALYVTTVIVGAVGLYQIYALLWYVERTNRDLVRFLQGIRAADFSPTFSGKGWGVAFEELHAAFTGVMDDFRRARSEKEEHAHVLQTVLQHVGIGVLAFQEDGEVALINAAARRLLNLQSAAVPYPGRGGQSDDLTAQVEEEIGHAVGGCRAQNRNGSNDQEETVDAKGQLVELDTRLSAKSRWLSLMSQEMRQHSQRSVPQRISA